MYIHQIFLLYFLHSSIRTRVNIRIWDSMCFRTNQSLFYTFFRNSLIYCYAINSGESKIFPTTSISSFFSQYRISFLRISVNYSVTSNRASCFNHYSVCCDIRSRSSYTVSASVRFGPFHPYQNIVYAANDSFSTRSPSLRMLRAAFWSLLI